MVFDVNHYFPLEINEPIWNELLQSFDFFCKEVFSLLESNFDLLKNVVFDAALEKDIWNYRTSQFPKEDNIYILGSGIEMLKLEEFQTPIQLGWQQPSHTSAAELGKKKRGMVAKRSNKSAQWKHQLTELQSKVTNVLQHLTEDGNKGEKESGDILSMLKYAQDCLIECNTVFIDLSKEDDEKEEDEGMVLFHLFLILHK